MRRRSDVKIGAWIGGAWIGIGGLALAGGCGTSHSGGSTGTTGRGAEIVACEPGASVSVGCGALDLGNCTGDPTLTACDGSLVSAIDCSRTSAGFLAFNDDTGASSSSGMPFCPGLTVTCPASGRLAVRPAPFSTTSTTVPYCAWETSGSGI